MISMFGLARLLCVIILLLLVLVPSYDPNEDTVTVASKLMVILAKLHDKRIEMADLRSSVAQSIEICVHLPKTEFMKKSYLSKTQGVEFVLGICCSV